MTSQISVLDMKFHSCGPLFRAQFGIKSLKAEEFRIGMLACDSGFAYNRAHVCHCDTRRSTAHRFI